RRPLTPPPFPYTPLFRSHVVHILDVRREIEHQPTTFLAVADCCVDNQTVVTEPLERIGRETVLPHALRSRICRIPRSVLRLPRFLDDVHEISIDRNADAVERD